MAAPKLASLVNQVQTLLRSNQKAYVTPEQMGYQIDSASDQLQVFLLGLVTDYKDGRPVPKITSEITSDVNNLLDPFREYDVALTKVGNTFQTPTPENIIKAEAWYADGEIAREPTANRMFSFTKSKIRMPSIQFPIVVVEGGFVATFDPVPAVGTAQIIRAANRASVFYDANFQVDETTSTEIQWGYRAIPYLLYYICQSFGVQTNTPTLIQYSTMQKQQGI
jgi:hypothetical protein